MVEAKTRRFATVLALIAGIALTGCEVSQDGGEFPPAPTETFTALYFSYAGDGAGSPWPYQPWPNDMWFSGSTDGTYNISAQLANNPSAAIYLGTPLAPQLNLLDGFSTTAYTTAPFSRPIDASTLTASTVRVVQLNLVKPNTPNLANLGLKVLEPGKDYKVEVSGDTDSGGKALRITPLKPFQYSSGANGIGYLFLVTNGVTDTSGQAAEPDELYSSIKGALKDPSGNLNPAGCSAFTNPTQKGICQVVYWQLYVAQSPTVGLDADDVVVSWSYITQSIDDSFNYLTQLVGPQPIVVVSVPDPTKPDGKAKSPGGLANIYVGSMQVPYYSSVPANNHDNRILLPRPTTSSASGPWGAEGLWVAKSAPPAPLATDPAIPYVLNGQPINPITRYNPIPLARGPQDGKVTIPVLVTVPNAAANGGQGCPRPGTAGWPAVVVQHGLFGNRTQALAMADAYASACFIVAAIDLPHHGITDTSATNPVLPFYCPSPPLPPNPLCVGAVERTFDLDVLNNATRATTPDANRDGFPDGDGKIDDSGVSGFFALIQAPIVMRDSTRQGELDLGVLSKSLANLDVTGDGAPDVDTTKIHFAGLSMGAIVGVAHAKFSPGLRTASVSAPGGILSQAALESDTFGNTIRSSLAATNALFVPNSTFFNNFFRDVQTIVDPADSINHICECSVKQPLLLFQVVGDTVVPNVSTQRLVTAGDLAQVTKLGATPVGNEGVWVNFTGAGKDHGTFFKPRNPDGTVNPAGVEMQKEAVTLAVTTNAGTPAVVISDKTVVEVK